MKWIQRFVEERPDDLQPNGLPQIEWLSPLAIDDFAEYRDSDFLDRIDCSHLHSALSDFWPKRGPQWDALGRTARGPILVEAKAHLPEFRSPACKAGSRSRAQIDAAFSSVRADLGASGGADWADLFFQYANRIAHLWFLRRHGVAAELVFVSFLGDAEMQGPDRVDVWQAAFAAADSALGLSRNHALACHTHHVFPDTRLVSERSRC